MFVLDTNVVSKLMLPHPLARVVDWVAQQPSQDMYISTGQRSRVALRR